MKRLKTGLLAFILSILLLVALFTAKIALWRYIPPSSTTFMRSEAARIAHERVRGEREAFEFEHAWVSYEQISDRVKEAVIASEDAGFTDHEGVDWEAIQKAWEGNNKGKRIKGGSTITQQLAKNLFLSGERSYVRKAEELYLTYALEFLLPKQRIFEIYLNSVEWGEGVFGVEAAAQQYFNTSAKNLSANQAARLAVMLPRPKYFEQRQNSRYLFSRASVIQRRMGFVDFP
jgi:monofunctional glycosyltransferase